jgi:hypothetical protein
MSSLSNLPAAALMWRDTPGTSRFSDCLTELSIVVLYSTFAIQHVLLAACTPKKM